MESSDKKRLLPGDQIAKFVESTLTSAKKAKLAVDETKLRSDAIASCTKDIVALATDKILEIQPSLKPKRELIEKSIEESAKQVATKHISQAGPAYPCEVCFTCTKKLLLPSHVTCSCGEHVFCNSQCMKLVISELETVCNITTELLTTKEEPTAKAASEYLKKVTFFDISPLYSPVVADSALLPIDAPFYEGLTSWKRACRPTMRATSEYMIKRTYMLPGGPDCRYVYVPFYGWKLPNYVHPVLRRLKHAWNN
jgi:hypothetical protein